VRLGVGLCPLRRGIGRHNAVRAGQNRRRRSIRGSRYASRPPAVRTEGRWKHLSVLDADGVPVNGTETLVVTLYNDSGGTLDSQTFTNQPVEAGHHSSILSGLNSEWFAGSVDLGIKVGTADELPTTPLISAPRAAHADHASRISVLAQTPTGTCDEGNLVYDAAVGRLHVCVAGSWDRNVALNNGVRSWSDGGSAGSCNGYRNPAGNDSYSGQIGDGIYRINPTGLNAFEVYCKQNTGSRKLRAA
jgi:hypothetical protein